MGRRKVTCFECQEKVTVSKGRKHLYPSKIPGHKGYLRDVCRDCHKKLKKPEKSERDKKIESGEICAMCNGEKRVKTPDDQIHPCPMCTATTEEIEELKKINEEVEEEVVKLPTQSEEVRHEPYPQSIESDVDIKGYLHEKKLYQVEIPKNQKELGIVVLDADRLSTHAKLLLGAELIKLIRELTGHKCMRVHIKAINVGYEVAHSKFESSESGN